MLSIFAEIVINKTNRINKPLLSVFFCAHDLDSDSSEGTCGQHSCLAAIGQCENVNV